MEFFYAKNEEQYICDNCEKNLKDKIIVRCKHCGYEKEYKSKNKERCIEKSKGHKPHHKFVIIKNAEIGK